MATTDRLRGLDSAVAVKQPVVCASTGNLTLESTQTIDGIAVNASDRVLAKDQTTGSENGIYAVRGSTWVRTADWDGSGDVVRGTQIYVAQGSVYAGWLFRVTSTDPVIGTDSVTFAKSLVGSLAAEGVTEHTGSGTKTLDFDDNTVHRVHSLTGAVTLTPDWGTANSTALHARMMVYVEQPSTGYTVTVTGVDWGDDAEPGTLNTANKTTLFTLIAPPGSTALYGARAFAT